MRGILPSVSAESLALYHSSDQLQLQARAVIESTPGCQTPRERQAFITPVPSGGCLGSAASELKSRYKTWF